MTVDEIKQIQTKIKFCMKRGIKVEYKGSEYIIGAMLLRYSESNGFYYTVELIDPSRLNSTVTAGICDVDFPSEGGGYKI